MFGRKKRNESAIAGAGTERPRRCNTGAGRARAGCGRKKKARLETPMLTKGRATTRADATLSKNKTTTTRRLETGSRRRTRQRATEGMARQKSTQRETSPRTQRWTDRFPTYSNPPRYASPASPWSKEEYLVWIRAEEVCDTHGCTKARAWKIAYGASRGRVPPRLQEKLPHPRRFTKDPARFFRLYITFFSFILRTLANTRTLNACSVVVFNFKAWNVILQLGQKPRPRENHKNEKKIKFC
jgi:hypothetical protein